jgi:cyclic beta-1,2-glucan synthetase
VLYADASLARRARGPATQRPRPGRALGALRSPATCPILLVRVVEENDLPLVRQVLQAQEYWRLKGLRADVVILNEHPVSYLDEMHAAARGAARLRAVGRMEAPAGGVLPAARRPHAEAERTCSPRSARRPQRRQRRAREPARPALPGAAVATGAADAPARAGAGARRPAIPMPSSRSPMAPVGSATCGREYVVVLTAPRRRRCRG